MEKAQKEAERRESQGESKSPGKNISHGFGALSRGGGASGAQAKPVLFSGQTKAYGTTPQGIREAVKDGDIEVRSLSDVKYPRTGDKVSNIFLPHVHPPHSATSTTIPFTCHPKSKCSPSRKF